MLDYLVINIKKNPPWETVNKKPHYIEHRQLELLSALMRIVCENPSINLNVAEKIQQQIVEIVEKNLPEGYKRGKMFSGEFLTGFKITFDFEGQKFADTAKRPVIEIGIDKVNFDVVLMIIEPLFKR